jgi:hypothetical protein
LLSSVFAGLAHLVEQLTCNHQVASSNPAAGTSKKPVIRNDHGFFLLWLFFAMSEPPMAKPLPTEGVKRRVDASCVDLAGSIVGTRFSVLYSLQNHPGKCM